MADCHASAIKTPIDFLLGKRILLAHSNIGTSMQQWHARREAVATRMGYHISTFKMTDYHPYIIFPVLDRMWRKRDSALMRLYEALGGQIDNCDVFIHYNGALIHPEFLAQFKKVKIYHCADDPDASNVISKPVAASYDICAISNPACIEMYKSWGCRHVFFWPLGAFHFSDETLSSCSQYLECDRRDIDLAFIGSKHGVTRMRRIHRIPLLNRLPGVYLKKSFFERIEREFPFIAAYGGGWKMGRIVDEAVPELYLRTKVGINVHNSLGPINGRLYDLAAFGVCQICDNKRYLHNVFDAETEIVGFENVSECVELVRYYLAHPDEARMIGDAARVRFQRDYTASAIWRQFVADVSKCISNIET